MARVISRRAWCAAAAGLAVALAFVLVAGRVARTRRATPQVTQAGTINGSPIRVGHAIDRHRRELERADGHDGPLGVVRLPGERPLAGPSASPAPLSQSSYTIQSGDVGRYIVLNLYAYRGQPQNPGTSGRAERFTITSSTVAPVATPTPTPGRRRPDRRRRRPRRSRPSRPRRTPTPAPDVRGPAPRPRRCRPAARSCRRPRATAASSGRSRSSACAAR